MEATKKFDELKGYFESATGYGVLSTADAEGAPDLALFARPHFLRDGELGFIMPERLTYRNLTQNPNAAYLFFEDKLGDDEHEYQGVRLYLRKLGEERDTERVKKLRRRTYDDDREGRYLVLFALEKVRPLVGGGQES